jgi:hypothetical protein
MKKSLPTKKPKRCPCGHTHLSWSPDKDEVYCWDCNKKYSLTECFNPRVEETQGN